MPEINVPWVKTFSFPLINSVSFSYPWTLSKGGYLQILHFSGDMVDVVAIRQWDWLSTSSTKPWVTKFWLGIILDASRYIPSTTIFSDEGNFDFNSAVELRSRGFFFFILLCTLRPRGWATEFGWPLCSWLPLPNDFSSFLLQKHWKFISS